MQYLSKIFNKNFYFTYDIIQFLISALMQRLFYNENKL